MNLSHSKTLENLINAFAGESQARNRYTFYAKQAKKEGYEKIATAKKSGWFKRLIKRLWFGKSFKFAKSWLF